MGGFGSGRQFGRPTVESSAVIDLAWMLRTGLANPGADMSGTITWAGRFAQRMELDCVALMAIGGAERLVLLYRDGAATQTVHLSHTVPNYGGKRWWMVCPYSGALVNKLYLPPGGHCFASRQVHRLAYRSERATAQARKLDRLFALQSKLGCANGRCQSPQRPKGMWWRTYARHLERYWQLEEAVCREFEASAFSTVN